MFKYEFDCQIDCPHNECVKDKCKYYDDCASCRWFWKCTTTESFGCERLRRKITAEQQRD